MSLQSPQKRPAVSNLCEYLDDFHAREILHVTFGSALASLGTEIRAALAKHDEVYQANLQKHFRKASGFIEIMDNDDSKGEQ